MMTQHGIDVLVQREGERLRAYRDSRGILTIGTGHTTAAGGLTVTPGLHITGVQDHELLAHDLRKFEAFIDRVVRVPCADHELDALYSACFNIGPKFAESHVIIYLNRNLRQEAADAFLMWNKPIEIRSRRRAERLQFLTPYSVHLPVARA